MYPYTTSRLILPTLFVVFFMLMSTAALAGEKPYAPEHIEGARTVSAEEVIDSILSTPDLVVIDSRKTVEYRKGHIEGAINILNTRLTLQALEAVVPDKTTPVLFYCNGVRCLRSSDSITRARDWGYSNLLWFRGGWKEWVQKRLPVVTE